MVLMTTSAQKQPATSTAAVEDSGWNPLGRAFTGDFSFFANGNPFLQQLRSEEANFQQRKARQREEDAKQQRERKVQKERDARAKLQQRKAKQREEEAKQQRERKVQKERDARARRRERRLALEKQAEEQAALNRKRDEERRCSKRKKKSKEKKKTNNNSSKASKESDARTDGAELTDDDKALVCGVILSLRGKGHGALIRDVSSQCVRVLGLDKRVVHRFITHNNAYIIYRKSRERINVQPEGREAWQNVKGRCPERARDILS
jgi:hypothetical protein